MSKIELPTADVKRIKKAADELGGEEEEKVARAYRWTTKAVKQFRGLRKTSMVPGEDGLKDTERDQLLVACNVKPEWLETNRSKLGYARAS